MRCSDEMESRESVRRSAWLVVAAVAGVSAFFTGLLPSGAWYTAEGALWIDDEVAQQSSSPGLPVANGWVELLHSGRVLDDIAEREGMEPATLSDRLRSRLDGSGHFLRISFTDPSAAKAASTVDAVMERHVDVATELGLVRLDAVVRTLEEQLRSVETDLSAVERELDRARTAGEVARLERQLGSMEAIYNDVARRRQVARLESQMWAPVRVVDHAVVSRPERSGLQTGIVLALLAALLVSLGLALTGPESARSGLPGAREQTLQLLIIFASAAAGLIATILIG